MARGNFKFIYLGFLGASNITSEGFYVAGILDEAQKKENESGPVVLRELFRVMERQFFINEKFSVSDMADFTFSYRRMVLTRLFKDVYSQISGSLNEEGKRKRSLYIITSTCSQYIIEFGLVDMQTGDVHSCKSAQPTDFRKDDVRVISTLVFLRLWHVSKHIITFTSLFLLTCFPHFVNLSVLLFIELLNLKSQFLD